MADGYRMRDAGGGERSRKYCEETCNANRTILAGYERIRQHAITLAALHKQIAGQVAAARIGSSRAHFHLKAHPSRLRGSHRAMDVLRCQRGRAASEGRAGRLRGRCWGTSREKCLVRDSALPPTLTSS